MRETYKYWLNYIYTLFDHTILIAHLKDKMIEKKGKEISAKDLDLTGKIKSMTCADVDAIAYLYREDNKTILNFQSSDEVLCGARPLHLQNKVIEIAEMTKDGLVADWSLIYTELKK